MVSSLTPIALSRRNQFIIAAILVILMVLTRDYHFASIYNLPGASWAVFFLAGIYLATAWPLLGLFALSWWLDFAAYAWGGADSFCLTPAYGFLLPAYISLWFAGRWYAGRYQFNGYTLVPLALSMTVGLVLCEIFSSGGFYFFSGHFIETTWLEFTTRTLDYFPMYMQSFVFYIGIAIVIHSAFVLVSRQTQIGGHRTG